MAQSHYTLYLHARSLPDRGWLESSVREMEPKFTFVGDFDPASDSAHFDCRISDAEGEINWTMGTPDRVPDGLTPRRYDRMARLGVGAGESAKICAALIAANLALISGGTLITPQGEAVGPDDALRWASDLIRSLRKGKRKPRAKKPVAPPPHELVSDWMAGLAGATVERMAQSLPGDSLFSIKFDNGLALMARRWSVSTPMGDERSTVALSRDMAPGEHERLKQAADRLLVVLRSGPVQSASFDQTTFSIQIGFAGGELQVLPEAAEYRSHEALLFRDGDRWELSMDAHRVYPDMDEKALLLKKR